MMRIVLKPALLSAAVLLLCANTANAADAEGYRVVSFDAIEKKWVLTHDETYEGKHLETRLTLACARYQKGKQKVVKGADACHLYVGRFLVPDQSGVKIAKPSRDVLDISEGEGDAAIQQRFMILKTEVVGVEK